MSWQRPTVDRQTRSFIARTAALAASALTLAMTAVAPVDARAGGSTLAYAAIGDSITSFGMTGADGSGGWVVGYAAGIDRALGTTTTTDDFGIPHGTSQQILSALRTDRREHDAVAAADLVTVQAGLNDFSIARASYVANTCGGADGEDCLRAMSASFNGTWDDLVAEVRMLAPEATLRAMTVYYPAVRLDQDSGKFAVLNSYLSRMNDHIAHTPEVPVADIHAVFNGLDGIGDPYSKGYLLPDVVHPNDVGQSLIDLQLRSLGYDGLPGNEETEADTRSSRAGSHALTAALAGIAGALLVAGTYARRGLRGR